MYIFLLTSLSNAFKIVCKRNTKKSHHVWPFSLNFHHTKASYCIWEKGNSHMSVPSSWFEPIRTRRNRVGHSSWGGIHAGSKLNEPLEFPWGLTQDTCVSLQEYLPLPTAPVSLRTLAQNQVGSSVYLSGLLKSPQLFCFFKLVHSWAWSNRFNLVEHILPNLQAAIPITRFF